MSVTYWTLGTESRYIPNYLYANAKTLRQRVMVSYRFSHLKYYRPSYANTEQNTRFSNRFNLAFDDNANGRHIADGLVTGLMTQNLTDTSYHTDSNGISYYNIHPAMTSPSQGLPIFLPLGGWRTGYEITPGTSANIYTSSIYANGDSQFGKNGVLKARVFGGANVVGLVTTLPWLTIGEFSTQLGELSLNVGINKDTYTGTEDDAFNTDYLKEKFNPLLDYFGVNAWNPLQDYDKFKTYFRFNPSNVLLYIHWSKVNIADMFLSTATDTERALSSSLKNNSNYVRMKLENEIVPYSVPSVSNSSSYDVGLVVPGPVTGDIELALIPNLKGTFANVPPAVVYKATANAVMSPMNNLILETYTHRYSSIADSYPLYSHGRLHILARSIYTDVSGKALTEPFSDKADFKLKDMTWDKPYWGIQLGRSSNGEAVETLTNYARPHLNFYLEPNTQNDGLMTWEVPENNQFVEGKISLPYKLINGIDAKELYHDDKFIAFLPAKFGTGLQLSRILPVNDKEKASLDTLLSTRNTDTVRQDLLTKLADKSGFHEGETITEEGGKEKREYKALSMENFDKYIDAPQTALPYVYRGSDLELGGKYHPTYTPTVDVPLLDNQVLDKDVPSYREQFNFTGRYGHTGRTIELALPYEEAELPANFPLEDGEWVGKGHVLPFELVYFSTNVVNRNATMYSTVESGSQSILTRADAGSGWYFAKPEGAVGNVVDTEGMKEVYTRNAFVGGSDYNVRNPETTFIQGRVSVEYQPNTFDITAIAKTKEDAEKAFKRMYTRQFVPFYMTERFDLDHIYTPPSNSHHYTFNIRVLTDGEIGNIEGLLEKYPGSKYIYRWTTNNGFNAYNKPSHLLMQRHNSELAKGHLPVPARMIADDGMDTINDYVSNYAYLEKAARYLTEVWSGKRQDANNWTYYSDNNSNGYMGPRLPYTPVDAEDTKHPYYKGQAYFRDESIYGLTDTDGKYYISNPNITTKDKVDYFFNNRLVSSDTLDKIRGGRHFENYLWQHDGSEALPALSILVQGKQLNSEKHYRIKNWVGYDFRFHMKEKDLTKALPFIRDNAPLKLKTGHKPYVDSTGFSMIVKPADTVKASISREGQLIPHVNQKQHFIDHKYYHVRSTVNLQSHTLSNSYLEADIVSDSYPSPNAGRYALTTASWLPSGDNAQPRYWGITTDNLNNSIANGLQDTYNINYPAKHNFVSNAYMSNYYRHMKAGQSLMQVKPNREALTTTASYFLSFIFMQSKWNQSKAQIEKALGVSDLNKVFLSSFSWYDEGKVHESVKAQTRQYLDGYFYNVSSTYDGMNYYDYPNYTHSNVRLSGHPSWTRYARSPIGEGGLVDKNLTPDMNQFPAAIIAGQTSGLNINVGHVSVALPAYYEQENMHAYDVFASRHTVMFGDIAAKTDDVDIRNRNIIGEYTVAKEGKPAIRFDYLEKHNRALNGYADAGAYDTDLTTAIELKNPVVTSTAFIARRIWEPFELIIPTKLKTGSHDWKDAKQWEMVEGYEDSNTYALMDKMEVGNTPVDVNGVMCYPVDVPLMYRPPKNAFDIACRMMNNTFSTRIVSPVGWFDFLCNDKPFMYTFHVADIAYLLNVYKKRKDINSRNYTAAANYQDSVYIYNPAQALVENGGKRTLSKEDEKQLLKEIGGAIGISPLLLKVVYTQLQGTAEAKVIYSDEKMGIGIPMFAGSINVSINGSVNVPPINVGVTAPKGNPNPSEMTEEELKAWLKANHP